MTDEKIIRKAWEGEVAALREQILKLAMENSQHREMDMQRINEMSREHMEVLEKEKQRHLMVVSEYERRLHDISQQELGSMFAMADSYRSALFSK